MSDDIHFTGCALALYADDAAPTEHALFGAAHSSFKFGHVCVAVSRGPASPVGLAEVGDVSFFSGPNAFSLCRS
jgi:hypothetical protein